MPPSKAKSAASSGTPIVRTKGSAAIETVRMRLTGTTPLLMHNIQLANPLNEWARAMKALNNNKKNLDLEVYAEEMRRLEFLGGIYWDREAGLHMPGRCMFRSLMEGATATKNGKALGEAVVEYKQICPVQPWAEKYEAPEEALADGHVDMATVKIGTSKVMRTRPLFTEWYLDFWLTLRTEKVSADTLMLAAEEAGRFKGIGDGRLKGYGMGRFSVERLP